MKAVCSCGASIKSERVGVHYADITFECGHRHEVYIVTPLREAPRLEMVQLSPCPFD